MGLFDALLGKRKAAAPSAADRLFAMSTAVIALEAEHGITGTHKAAIVFQPLGTGDFQAIVTEMEEVVRGTGEETGTTMETSDDSFGYRWMIFTDPDTEDLVVATNAVNDALAVGGYADRALCAVFAFKDASGKPLYLIYNFKRGAWYPFVPAPGQQQRSTEEELQLKAKMGAELPFEADPSRWFPLWGAPI